MNWVLLAVIILLLAGIIIGSIKGFVKMIFSTLAIVIIVAVAVLVAPRLAPFLKEHTSWYDGVHAQTEQYLSDHGFLLTEENGQLVTDGLDSMWLPDSMKDKILSECNEKVDEGIATCNEFMTSKIADGAFSVIVFVGVFVAVALAILVLWIVLNALSKLPGIREVNRLGGGILGFVGALVAVEVLIVIFTALAQTEFGTYVNGQIQSNAFLKWIYDTNPILLLIGRFL